MNELDKSIEDLRALGAGNTEYPHSAPNYEMLECFDNPMKSDGYWMAPNIVIEAPEFTSLCPKTGQPDFAKIIIEYCPDLLCVESKSFKLYLGTYRMQGMFHEACVQQICNDLASAMDPKWIEVEGQFAPRGGITFWPTARWDRDGFRHAYGGTTTGRISSKEFP